MNISSIVIRRIALPVLCLLLSACSGSNTAAEAPAKVIPVNAVNPVVTSIANELAYPGQVKASEQIAVMSKLSGKVDEVMVRTGDIVNEGDILFTMDKTDLANNIKSLEAQIKTADAAINSAQTGVTLASGSQMKSQILQAEGGMQQASKNVEQSRLAVEQREMALNQAQVAYDNALKNLNDTTVLYKAGITSEAQFKQAETALTNAEIALEQAQAGYNSAGISLEQAQTTYEQSIESHSIVSNDTLSESIRRAQDALAQAVAQKNSLVVSLEAAMERLDDAAVRSPISGVISSRSVEPKTMLAAGTAPFTVVSVDTVEVKVNVTEVIINKIETGQEIDVWISAASDEPFLGKIITISPAANDITSAFEVRIELDNKSGIIKPGMYAEAHFIKEKADEAVVVPRNAVVVENGVKFVYTAENGLAKRNEVKTGVDNGQGIEITHGINAEDLIIIKGQNYVKDGTPIKIEERRGDGI